MCCVSFFGAISAVLILYISFQYNVSHFCIKIKCVSFVTGNLHTLFYTYEKNENGKIGVAVDESMLLAWGIEEHELWGEAVKKLMNEDFTICNIDNATGISSAALKGSLGVPPLDD